MSFREKSAWIQFVTVLLAAMIFVGAEATLHPPAHQSMWLFALCTAGLIGLQIVLHVAAAITNPADAMSPKDERERDIELKSHRVGYYVLLLAVLAMFVTGHATMSARALMYHAAGAVALATLAIALWQIILYRRGG
jgi:hypothetical protein